MACNEDIRGMEGICDVCSGQEQIEEESLAVLVYQRSVVVEACTGR